MGEPFNEAFYETVATVIPVIVAVLFFESGYFARRPKEKPELSIFAVTAMIILIAAEANVLGALWERENLDGVRRSVLLIGLFWGLGSVAMIPISQRLAHASSRMRRASMFWLIALTGFFWAAWTFLDVDPFVLFSYAAYVLLVSVAIPYFHWRQVGYAKRADEEERSKRFHDRFGSRG
jgi:hypothetical protein